MSPFSRRTRDPEQPQASTSTSAPQTVPQTPGPSTPPPNNAGSTDGLFDKAAIADMKATALDLANTIAGVAAEVADVIPVPGLKIGLSGLVVVMQKIQVMQENVEGVAMLQQRVGSLVASLRELHARSGSQPLPDGMLVRITELVRTWTAIGERAAKVKSHGRVMRFLRSGRDAKKLGDLVGEINDSIQDKVMMQGILNIERYMLDVYEALKQIRAHLEASFLSKYARKAHFDSNQVRNGCLPGTRVEILHQICTWVTAACAHGQSIPMDGIVFWINGLGGTGKTTIAYSVARWCELLGILGGSFFCSRSDDECNDPNMIFLTLCRQLCHRHAGYMEKVAVVLREKPDIVDCGPYRQFEELVLRPLEEFGDSFPRSVFVLDALDECRDKDVTSMILSVIAKYARRIAKYLLFIVTSRPEEHITARFEASREDSLTDTATPLLLHDIPLEVVTEDIKRYLDHEFNDKIGMLSIKKGWPSIEQKRKLAEQSQGLFIYVATAVKFIMDETYRDPKGQMRSLITHGTNSFTPHEFLFALYSKILVASYKKTSPKLAERLRDVLGIVVLAYEPLSPYSVARLAGLDVADVRNTLSGLHSVLHIPARDDDPIRIIHPTFPEFLLQSPETIPLETSELAPISAPLRLQPAAQHWYLFSRCIVAMTDALKRDIIGMRYPAMFRSEVENLEERVDAAIEPHVNYASRFWGNHLRDGVMGSTTLDAFLTFHDFVKRVLLYWIEACSLLDTLERAAFALNAAREACLTLGGQYGDLAQLLANCWRFVLDYSPQIHAAPLQIYHCALSLAPSNSTIGQTYAHECQHALVVDHGLPANWEPCIHAVMGHRGSQIYGVAFSPDGSYFVTAGCDRKATVWTTTTRTPVASFDGHAGDVNCVAYAPNGQHVASGSSDQRVCVWQASSGECLHTLMGHTNGVYTVAYSGDGRRLLSATRGGEMKLWDTTDGRCLLTLDRTGNWTVQVALSPDGGAIAHSKGASVSLYDVSSSATETLEFPDTVAACAFSPDGRYLAARSTYVIRIWAWADKSLVRSIKVIKQLTSRLSFSHDGVLIGCGSEDGSVFLWPVASEDSPRTLEGHTDWVLDLAYSPDMSQTISVSGDGMIRVWDLTSSSMPTEEYTSLDLPPSSSGLPRFALVRSARDPLALLDLPALGIDPQHLPIGANMPHGAAAASLFPDVASAWDAALHASSLWIRGASSLEQELLTGQRYSQLSPGPLAISPDGTLLAHSSSTSDTVVDVYDLRTGAVVTTLTGQTKYIRSIAFSPDNARLATGSQDFSVKVWDAQTGALTCGHTEHHGWTRAVAFSPDGRLVASGSSDRTVRIFELETQRVICVLGSHRDWVFHVMFAADNVHLIALDDAHWVYVWDVTTGARIDEFCLQDHSRLRSPLFSPDGTGILVCGADGAERTISFWAAGMRIWPVYHITEDGWVYAFNPRKTHRVCCFPPEWRTALRSEAGMLYVVENARGPREKRKLIALRMSNLVEYIDTLDARYPESPVVDA